jgi:hypothetical protein
MGVFCDRGQGAALAWPIYLRIGHQCLAGSTGRVRIEARIGLRMMPTFPRSPLSFAQ